MRFALMCLTALFVSACGGRSADTAPEPKSTIDVIVENHNFHDARIYAVDGYNNRLTSGTLRARGNATTTFAVTRDQLRGSGVRFAIEQFASGKRWVLDHLPDPGSLDFVRITVMPILDQSYFTAY